MCHETVRFWWNSYGPLFAGDVRRARVSRVRGFRHWRWHLDETYVKLGGEMVYLWRAVGHEGEVLESYAVGLRSYGAAMTQLGNGDKQEVGRWANDRVENGHLPFRRRERTMHMRAPPWWNSVPDRAGAGARAVLP